MSDDSGNAGNPFGDMPFFGDLSNMVGWKNKDIVEKLEQKRLAKSQVYFEAKKKKTAAKAKQINDGRLSKLNEELKKYGF